MEQNKQDVVGKNLPALSLVSKLQCPRPFICDICDMRFDEKTHLRQHIGHRHLLKVN